MNVRGAGCLQGKTFRFIVRRKWKKYAKIRFLPTCKKQQYRMKNVVAVGTPPAWNAVSNSSSAKSSADEAG